MKHQIYNISTNSFSTEEVEATVESDEKLATNARSERSSLLLSSDWSQTPDATVDKTAWLSYRTLLRDVPQQAGFPSTILWPQEPSA